MYIISNRKFEQNKKGLKRLGETPAPEGPNELRLYEIGRKSSNWTVKQLPDTVTPAMKREMGFAPDETVLGSQYVAKKLFVRARNHKRNMVIFVHGYNNNVEAVMKRAFSLERTFGVDVVPFSWPANGGGLKGLPDYKSDKRDARASAGALDRTLAKAATYLKQFTQQGREDAWAATARHADDLETRERVYLGILERTCPFTVNLMLHSMGNYLLKQMVKSSVSEGNQLVFDNVIMASADTNNENHREWVGKIRYKNRLYITINEKDKALMASRAKSGSDQKSRLGHSLSALNCERATYINFTGAKDVGRSHSYFEGAPVKKGNPIRTFFEKALSGQVAEDSLFYNADKNVYAFKKRK